jgi:hypothetical protein
MVPDATTAASGGSLLFAQYRPFAILKPKNRKANRNLQKGMLLGLSARASETDREGSNKREAKGSRMRCILFVSLFVFCFFFFMEFTTQGGRFRIS